MADDYGLPMDRGESFYAAAREYALNPTDETWENLAHKIIPNGKRCRTVWQAWLRVDPKAPNSLPSTKIGEVQTAAEKWKGRRPDVFTLDRALRESSGGDTRLEVKLEKGSR